MNTSARMLVAKISTTKFLSLACLAFVGSAIPASNFARAEEPAKAASPEEEAKASAALAAAKKRLTAQKYDLHYQFTADELLRWKVTHLVTVETRIQGSTQTAKTRSVSTKEWKVLSVDAEGNATIVHQVADVDMWQQVTDRSEVRYNSKSDKEVPKMYEAVAKTVGVPLTKFTLDRYGAIVKREDLLKQPGANPGQVTVPLPRSAVRIGDRWETPNDIPVILTGGGLKILKGRQVFKLASVEKQIATIEVETQVLSPVDDPEIKVQLVQRLTKGHIQFDMAAGRVIGQETKLDETVISFRGADSIMQYLARSTDELLPAIATAEKTPAAEKK